IHQRADPRGRQRIAGDAVRGRVDRPARCQSARQRRCIVRLHPDDAHAACGEPRRDACDQTAAADGRENGVDAGFLLLDLASHGAGAQQRLELVERMHVQRTGIPAIVGAGVHGVRVALADHDEVGAVGTNPLDLRCGGDARNEDLRTNAPAHRRIRDRRAVIAARRGRDACRGNGAQYQVRERPARLERARNLQRFELQQRVAREAGIRPAQRQERGRPYPRRNGLVRGSDRFARNGAVSRRCGHAAMPAWRRATTTYDSAARIGANAVTVSAASGPDRVTTTPTSATPSEPRPKATPFIKPSAVPRLRGSRAWASATPGAFCTEISALPSSSIATASGPCSRSPNSSGGTDATSPITATRACPKRSAPAPPAYKPIAAATRNPVTTAPVAVSGSPRPVSRLGR